MNLQSFYYLGGIVLLLFCLLTGFSAGDRLPSEMPENQAFDIDTVVDATGFVTRETSVNWIIDHQDLESMNGVLFNGVNWGLAHALSPEEIAAFEEDGVPYTTAIDPGTGVTVLMAIDIPTYLLGDILNPAWDPGVTYQEYLNYLTSGDWYAFADKINYGSIHDGKLNPTEEIAVVNYKDTLLTNGGKLSLNQNFGFDSRNKGSGFSNLESEKVLTYESSEGAHLTGAEELTLDVAGNFKFANQSIRCVFADSSRQTLPAFCNVVSAKSELVNFNSGQVSAKGSIRAVAKTDDVPAGLNYQIAVTPDAGSGSGFAEGTVTTTFAGSIMEARGRSNQTSAENTWKDTTTVTGGIKNLQKVFAYESGMKT